MIWGIGFCYVQSNLQLWFIDSPESCAALEGLAATRRERQDTGAVSVFEWLNPTEGISCLKWCSNSTSLYYERAALINVWEQSGCSCGCFLLSLDATICVHHLKQLSVYVKDESLDSTSLGSSPQFHWMLEKGMVGLIGWWDGQSVQCVTCCWLSLCTCCSGLVFFFFFQHVKVCFSFGERRVSAVLLSCRLHVLSFIILICWRFGGTFWCLVDSVPQAWILTDPYFYPYLLFLVFPFQTNLFPILRTET